MRPLPRYRGMHLDDERLYPLLDRYLAGEASPADAAAVREWLADDPEHALLLEDLRLIKRVAASEHRRAARMRPGRRPSKRSRLQPPPPRSRAGRAGCSWRRSPPRQS